MIFYLNMLLHFHFLAHFSKSFLVANLTWLESLIREPDQWFWWEGPAEWPWTLSLGHYIRGDNVRVSEICSWKLHILDSTRYPLTDKMIDKYLLCFSIYYRICLCTLIIETIWELFFYFFPFLFKWKYFLNVLPKFLLFFHSSTC